MPSPDWTGELQDRLVRAGMTGRFHSYEPEQLWAMVSVANGATPKRLSDLLTAAATTIREIGSDLREHSMAVEWDGEAGDAFRKWCHQAAMTTLRLGDYSEKAGKWMSHAADTLYEVKPQIEALYKQAMASRTILNTSSATGGSGSGNSDAPGPSEVKNAKTQYAKDHADAAGMMVKLAQSYNESTEQIVRLEAPKFPELPERFVPPTSKRITQDEIAQDGAKDRLSSSVPSSSQSVITSTGTDGALHEGGARTPDSAAPTPTGHVGTNLDSVAAPPEHPATPPASVPGPPPAGRPEISMPPPITGLPTTHVRPGLPTQALPGSRPTTGHRGVPGSPANNGIIGGRPVPPVNNPAPGAVPRGTGVGDTARPGQTPAGRAPAPGMPGAPAAPGQTPGQRPGVPPVNGTPRATTSGGPVGTPNTPTRMFRGVIGESQPPTPRTHPSTGRTGGPAADSITATPRQAGARPATGSTSRPGRATEPEETWQLGHRRPIPPVID